MRTMLLLAAIVALPLSACSEAPEGDMTPDAGFAVRHNIEAQVVNPNAPTGNGAFVTDGERVFRAIDRYNKGTVTPPASVSTGAKGASASDDSNTSGSSNTP